MELMNKIKEKQAKVGVIGLGYVGLPLAIEVAKSGYNVLGIDINKEKLDLLLKGCSYVLDVKSEDVQDVINKEVFSVSYNFDGIRDIDIIIVCVPTPLSKTKTPDLSYIQEAVSNVIKYMHRELLIILESTTYPGTTEELIIKPIEEQGYSVGKDFYVCFSPERVDPGNKKYNTKNTPKVIGGATENCKQLVSEFYGNIIDNIVLVSSTKVAETVKLLENTFRAVNIGLVNEMAIMCNRMGIDVWEVIDAASTKPFGFMPFYPGPGIGGHCIPLDPQYLAWKAKMYDYYNRFIELASDINGNMPYYVVNRISDVLNMHKKSINGSKILLLGMAYKKDINDVRESPTLTVYELLKQKGATIEVNDLYVESFIDESGNTVHSKQLTNELLYEMDIAILMTDHSEYNYVNIAKNSKLVLDTRNAFKNIRGTNIYKL
jgi:UDP-N-acetyl-D-glucosamine dehydrogenase